jgi:hypothetical protein
MDQERKPFFNDKQKEAIKDGIVRNIELFGKVFLTAFAMGLANGILVGGAAGISRLTNRQPSR